MEQIKVENGIIVDHIMQYDLEKGYIKAENFDGFVGDKISYYDENWHRYPESYLYKSGLKEVPVGFIFDNSLDDIRELTEVELIQNKLKPMPKGYKIVNDKLIPKTMQEQFKAGDIDVIEYSDYQRSIRNSYLTQTDKYLLPDYPILPSDLQKIKDYRVYLRDLPLDPKFPDVEIIPPMEV